MNISTITYKTVSNAHEIRKYTSNPNVRGAIFVTDTNCIYMVNEAQEIIEVCQTNNNKQHICIEQRPTNCKNCAAPLTSYKCEYCSTEYYY